MVARGSRSDLPVRVVGALALGASGALHLWMALERPPLAAAGQVTLSGLFLVQGLVALAAAAWVLLRGPRTAWLVLGAVAAASLVAVVLSVMVRIPAIGPLPALYEPFWYPEKVFSAVTAAVATVVAVVALATRRTGGGSDGGPPAGRTGSSRTRGSARRERPNTPGRP